MLVTRKKIGYDPSPRELIVSTGKGDSKLLKIRVPVTLE